MKKNSVSYRIQRKSELSKFMGSSLDDLLEEEARQEKMRMAVRAIHWHVVRSRASSGDIGQRMWK